MRNILIFFSLLIIIPTIYASCDDIDYSVNYIDKDENGCYQDIQFVISRDNCVERCYENFTLLNYTTNLGFVSRYFIGPELESVLISYPKINCSNGVPDTFYAKFTGNETCEFSVSFNDAYDEVQLKIQESKNNAVETENNVVLSQKVKNETYDTDLDTDSVVDENIKFSNDSISSSNDDLDNSGFSNNLYEKIVQPIESNENSVNYVTKNNSVSSFPIAKITFGLLVLITALVGVTYFILRFKKKL